MTIKIEGMEPSDYLKLGREVKDGFEADNTYLRACLDSEYVFGSSSYGPGEERPIETYHRRGYIHLCKPVINFAIAAKHAELLRKILGADKDLTAEVVELRTCYDKRTKQYIHIDMVEHAEDIMWGAEVLKMWIDNLDIESAIKDILTGALKDYSKKEKIPGKGKFVRGGATGYVAAGDWRFISSTQHTYEGLAEYIGKNVFDSKDSRLTYLLNLQDNKARLYTTIMEYIAVIPIGMRPDIDNRHDQMSCAYDEVISANKNLRMAMIGMFDPRTFAQHYRTLSEKVYNLLVEPSKLKENRRSVLGKLASKKGHVRSKMLGRRVDYSGRSVITIDPFLSLRRIKLPRDMAPKLYRSHILSSMSNPNPADWIGPAKDDKCIRKLLTSGILDEVPTLIGRQPTLHKPSMRAFQVELTEGRSIGLNPLCVEGYNADFDGDQMWVRVPVSVGAVSEARDLMTVAQNFFYPKNGECAFKPRHEIVYGLNVCTRSTLVKGASIKTYHDGESLFEDLFKQRVKVSDTVTLGGMTECAGRVAFAMCFPSSIRHQVEITEVTAGNIAKYIEQVIAVSIEDTIDTLDLMVRLGFKISYIYPATLNLLDGPDETYVEEIGKFHEKMGEITTFYERGLEEESSYDAAYDEAATALDDAVKSTIYEHVGKESGFVRLAESGARGSKSNIVQMYGYKGRIQKSARESFRAVIEHSYTEQLTALEHFVTAHGGRPGLINRSVRTADTGYAMRLMWHATSPYTITTRDCGVTQGIVIRKSDIAMFTSDIKDVGAVFANIITGRYEAGTNRYIDRSLADQMGADSECTAVTIRSILTCNDPCCKMCYGDDPSTRQQAATKLPIGFIAAQAIGEPGTQLSMDSFKKGGLASKTGITSSFEKLDVYINCRSLSDRESYGAYDPIAWESGEVRETYNADGTKTVKIAGSLKSIKVPAEAVLKMEAVRGEGLCAERGDYDITELLEHAGLTAAQMYLLHTFYHIYKDECEISMKHFETLVASMTMYMVVATDRKDLKAGQFHDSIQMHRGSLRNTRSVPTIVGVKKVQTLRTSALSRMAMEYLQSGLASSMLLGLEDPLDYPINRMILGKKVLCGGPEFVKERKL